MGTPTRGNTTYDYRAGDDSYKPVEELVRAASAGTNLLLNVGPTGDGEIPAPAQERLAAIGAWLRWPTRVGGRTRLTMRRKR